MAIRQLIVTVQEGAVVAWKHPAIRQARQPLPEDEPSLYVVDVESARLEEATDELRGLPWVLSVEVVGLRGVWFISDDPQT